MSADTYAAVEDALRAHLADEIGDHVILTDWYIVTAAETVEGGETRYTHIGSESPWHTQHGLLSLAQRRLLDMPDED